jgi:hypothetical protein
LIETRTRKEKPRRFDAVPSICGDLFIMTVLSIVAKNLHREYWIRAGLLSVNL